ncbi:MAG: ABC transporter permease [Bdellovibrionales bacterium]
MQAQALKKYWSIFKAFVRASLIAELEFRLNFAMRIINDIFWYAAQIFTFEVLFMHTEQIGSWNRAQTRVFLGMLFIVDALYMIFLQENLDRFSEKVRKGDLDLLLSKPINSQFMVSLQRISVSCFGNFLIACGWFVWSLSQLPDFNWWRILWVALLAPCGFAILYSIRFSVAALCLIFVRADNIQYVWYQLYRLGMRPDSIYAPWLKILVLTVLPVALIASVPARAILDPPETWVYVWTLTAAPLAVIFSSRFWRYCLKHYQSASS